MLYCDRCDEEVEKDTRYYSYEPLLCEPCNDRAVDDWCSGGAERAAEAHDMRVQRDRIQMYDAGRLSGYPY